MAIELAFCPRCGKEITENADRCPNCSHALGGSKEEDATGQRPQNVVVTPTKTPRTSVSRYSKRAAPITAASILCLIMWFAHLAAGFVLIALYFGLAGHELAPGATLYLNLGIGFGVWTGVILLASAVLHLAAWRWLWIGSMKGGVMGIIAGIIDLCFPLAGSAWLLISLLPSLGLTLFEVPFLIPIMLITAVLGIVIIVMIALGWKTLWRHVQGMHADNGVYR